MAEAPGSETVEERAKRVELEARQEEEARLRGQKKARRRTAAMTATRDLLIVQRVAEGWTWAMIAEEAGISLRQCQRVAEAYREMPSPLDIDPTTIVEELARGYRQSVSAFTALAASADNTAAAVGALKGANDARERMVAVLQAIGHVPHDLGVLKLQRDVQQVAVKMLEAVEAFERGDIESGELAAVFYDLAGIRRELPRGDGGGD
jgi:hypothetical protein